MSVNKRMVMALILLFYSNINGIGEVQCLTSQAPTTLVENIMPIPHPCVIHISHAASSYLFLLLFFTAKYSQ